MEVQIVPQYIKKEPPLWEVFLIELIGGSIGAALSVAVGQPLDTVRVRIQNTVGHTGIFGHLQRAIKNDGFFSLFRGMSSPLYGVPFFTALNFGTFGIFKQMLNIKQESLSSDPQTKITQMRKEPNYEQLSKIYLCGCFSGFIQSFLCAPIELCKLAMQIDTSKRNTYNSVVATKHASSLDVAKYIYKNYGIQGMYRGMGVTLIREIPSYGFYFSVYELVKHKIQQKYANEGNLNSIQDIAQLIGGGIAGVACWTSTYPADVIKSRVQMDYDGRKYQGAFDCFKKSIKEEKNIRFLFKGYKATIIRALPVNAVLFYGYEMTLKGIESLRSYL